MKKYLFLCSFIVFSVLVRAQSLQQTYNRTLDLVDKRDYKKAIPALEKAITLFWKKWGEKDSTYIGFNYLLATCYRITAQYEKAESQYLKVIALQEKTLGSFHSDLIQSMDELASVYASKRNYEKAEALFLRVIKLRETKGKDKAYIFCISSLGKMYISMVMYEKAEPLLIEANDLKEKLLGKKHQSVAFSLCDLGELYRQMGRYDKAEQYFIEAIEIAKNTIGENNLDYATYCNDLGTLYMMMNQFVKAEALLINATAIWLKISGDLHPDHATGLNNLGGLYAKMGRYNEAALSMIRANKIIKKISGEVNTDYATGLNNLGSLYLQMGVFEKAKPLLLRANEIDSMVLGKDHPDYAISLSNLGKLYSDMGQYKKAESILLRSSEIIKKALGEEHPHFSSSLNLLGGLYAQMGQYEKALFYAARGLEIKKKVLGDNHPGYATSLMSVSGIYRDMGQYEKALTLLLQAKEILGISAGENDPLYAYAISQLGNLYIDLGKYEKTEPLFLQAREITRVALGEDHPDYADRLYDLGEFYYSIGQYRKATPFYVQANHIREKSLGTAHPDYATSLEGLGKLYELFEENEKAESLYLQAIALHKTAYGEDHPSYAVSLDRLAGLYVNMKQYEKAETIYLRSTEITRRWLGENHPDYACALNNMSVLYAAMDRYTAAESLYVRTREIQQRVLGVHHPDYATSSGNLALFYMNSGQYEKAEPLFILQGELELQNLKNTFTILSEKEKGDYLATQLSVLETNNSFLFYYGKAAPSICRKNFDLQLALKSLSLSDTRNMVEAVNNSPDTALRRIFNKWKGSKSFLSKQYSLPLSKRVDDLKTEEINAENLEKELVRKSSEFRNQQNAIRISMTDVQRNLQPDEAAIEFVKFRLINKKWTDSIIYAAYLVKQNDSTPRFIPLCEEKQLGKYFSSTGGASNIITIYRSDPLDEKDKPSISGDSLYALVWKPLQPYLKGIKKIDYSPAGLLYKIAFHALPTGDSSLLMDKYELTQYTSIRQLAFKEEKKVGNVSIALFGNCNFSMDSAAIIKNIPASDNANDLITAPIGRGDHSRGWKALTGTASEINAIGTLFEKAGFTENTYSQENATEEQFKSLSSNSTGIIHLATHGFFLPDPEIKKQEGFETDKRNAFTLADDPLLRSGIVLSGANRVWGGQPPIAGREDGIVTAYEIAQLDLAKTDLVVLSACETALGDVKGNEGVFGLQRAFKMAGVKHMLLSLWKVPDAETAELMKIFYTYYLQGKSAREAFSTAQQEMRKRYSPYYWAAFVLIE